jgi:dolichyl-phosphate-mannose--protein O-mannosyl transferase
MINFLKKIEYKIKILRKLRLINPYQHWFFLVVFFLIIVFVLIIFSFYLLFKIKNDQIFQIDQNLSNSFPSLIKEDILEKAEAGLKKKENKTKEIEKKDFFFKDPS